MRRERYLLLAGCFAITALWACGGGGNGASTSNSTTTTAGRETDGASIFRTECAGCHGANGEGNLGPALSGIADRMSVADQTAVVEGGRGRMPGFASSLTESQIAAVVDYTRTQLH
jgi:mono/diheme cytochrome c family protein